MGLIFYIDKSRSSTYYNWESIRKDCVELMKMERIDRVRAALCAQGLTQMIVCDPKSVWYLTGVAVEPYERLLALYLPTDGEPVLFLNKLFNVPNPPCKAKHTSVNQPKYWNVPPSAVSGRHKTASRGMESV